MFEVKGTRKWQPLFDGVYDLYYKLSPTQKLQIWVKIEETRLRIEIPTGLTCSRNIKTETEKGYCFEVEYVQFTDNKNNTVCSFNVFDVTCICILDET